MVPVERAALHPAKRQAVECLLSVKCPREAMDWNPRLRELAFRATVAAESRGFMFIACPVGKPAGLFRRLESRC